MSSEIYNLFVYGSLRSGFRNPVYEYLTKYFHLLGEAVVKGKLYDLGNYPAAAATEEEKFISGELYTINNPKEFSWAIGQLDDYEGVNVAYDEVQMYYRAITDVYFNDQIIPSWIYWFNGDVSNKPLIASGDNPPIKKFIFFLIFISGHLTLIQVLKERKSLLVSWIKSKMMLLKFFLWEICLISGMNIEK